MRATSDSPSAWIASGVRSVVVELRTCSAYHAAPSGNADQPTDVRAAGDVFLLDVIGEAGVRRQDLLGDGARYAAVRRERSGSPIDSGIAFTACQKRLFSGSSTTTLRSCATTFGITTAGSVTPRLTPSRMRADGVVGPPTKSCVRARKSS